MDLGIAGRTALVTGADSGIGWHTAKLLLAEGATVAITDRAQAELDAGVTGARGLFHEIDAGSVATV